MKEYPDDIPWREIFKAAIPFLVILVAFFTVMAAVSAPSIAWLLSGEAESLPLQNKDGLSITSGKDSASPLWRVAR